MLLILNYMFPIMLVLLVLMLPINIIHIIEKYNNAKKITFKTILFPLSLIAIILLYISLLLTYCFGHENYIYHEKYLERLDNSMENSAFKEEIKRKINKDFSNTEHKIHILSDDKHVSELENTNAIIGVKELKKEGNDILVELDILDNNSLFKNKIALLNQKSLSAITENIYGLNNSPTFIESFPSIKSNMDSEKETLNEKQDIDTIKKMVINK